jgi:CubicO group peptidase (beta-lactamase class C family)
VAAGPRLAWGRSEPAPPGASAFAPVDGVIDAAIAAGNAPGAVLCVGQRSGVTYLKSYGRRAVRPGPEEMTDDTVFDLASLTKPVATATSVMLLAERGKLSLADKVAQHVPAFAAGGKADVTVGQLLLHRGGVIADNPMSDFADGVALALRRTLESPRAYEPGAKVVYSDVGYMALGELVRAVDGRRLDAFAREEVFGPLAMTDTTYLPPDALKTRCAPTEQRDGRWMRGEVHDPRAYALLGVAGHAGLFGTAADLARYCRMLMGGGELDGTRLLAEATVREMTVGRALSDGTGVRSYGFDVDTPYSSPRGERFTKGVSFGHTGFTGTSLWIDPPNDVFVILLTNAVHPDGKGKVVQLRRAVSTAVADVVLGPVGSDGAKPRAGDGR